MNILWHTWEPGLAGNTMTSGGGAQWTSHLFDELARSKHQVMYFRHDAAVERVERVVENFRPHVGVICWRWEFPNTDKYKERNEAYFRQMALLEAFAKRGVPFLVHDQDLKMSVEDRKFVLKLGGVIATPSFFPAKDEISLHFPNPFVNMKVIDPKRWSDRLVYVGNNYERTGQFLRYVGVASNKITIDVYGNWLEHSPDRMSPEALKEAMPSVNFFGRLQQELVIDVMESSKATILLHKPEYGERGFVTIRWAESAAAGTIPFIPAEFALPSSFEEILQPIIVENGEDLAHKFKSIKKKDIWKIIESFRFMVHTYMSSEKWVETLEKLI